jgi:hypothetical protein
MLLQITNLVRQSTLLITCGAGISLRLLAHLDIIFCERPIESLGLASILAQLLLLQASKRTRIGSITQSLWPAQTHICSMRLAK